METYLPFCEQYAAMAQCFYSQYQQSAAGNDVIDSIAMEQSAICAVIFQALAVESYVNLFGSVILGDENFRNNYESETDKKHRFSTLKKIKRICRDEFNTLYPTGGQHFKVLRGLFSKRDRLVHQKSKPYNIEKRPLDYDNMAEQYDDYLHAYETEIGFIYERLEDEMKVYEELKENLTRCSGREEVIKSLLEKYEKEIAKRIANSIKGDVQ